MQPTSVFTDRHGERVRPRAVVHFRSVDFGEVEPVFAGVGPSVDFFGGGGIQVEVLDKALADDVDGGSREDLLRPN